jgi:hypothetical protein
MHERSKTGCEGRSIDETDDCRRVWPALALCALACALTACSTRTSEREVLPWFIEHTGYFKFGSYSEAPEGRTYRTQHMGFWRPVEAQGAVALSDVAVLLDLGAKGRAVLVRGALTPTPVCSMYGEVSVPPSTSTVDCLQVISDAKWSGLRGYHGLSVRRTRFDGETVYEKTIEVPDESHALDRFSLYDGTGTAYFLAISTAYLMDKQAPPDCMLLKGFGQETRVAARRPDVTDVMQCYRPETWRGQIGPTVARWDTIKYPGSSRDPRR